MPVSKSELSELMTLIKAYSIVEARVANFRSKNVAVLDSIKILAEEDAELAGIREELLIPVRVNTQEFGTLELDRRLGNYVGEVEWCGFDITLNLACADSNASEAVLAPARALFRMKEDWNAKITEFAADRLLLLKNENWLQDDESEISRHEFISRMSLNEIVVEENGDFTFYYDDGDLFWGHCISVSGNLGEGLTDADI